MYVNKKPRCALKPRREHTLHRGQVATVFMTI